MHLINLGRPGLALAAWMMIAGHPASAQDAPFTYQGRLNTNGAPYTGAAEFQFTLWDAPSEGNAVATNNPASVVATVTNGLFTVTLDFGVGPFNGEPRFLQLDVRTASEPFLPLSPRQPVTATPYALRALNALTAGYVSGTLTNTTTGNAATATAATTADVASYVNGTLTNNTTGNAGTAATTGTATNVVAGGSVTTSNVFTTIADTVLTNAHAFLGYGGLQLSQHDYAGVTYAQTNNRFGIEWPDYPWDGTPLQPYDGSTMPAAFISVHHNWGGGTSGSPFPTLHFATKGSMRLEPNWGQAEHFGNTYLTIGNEDGNHKTLINYSSSSVKDDSGVPIPTVNGYSLPLYWYTVGNNAGVEYSARPAIQGWFAGTNGGYFDTVGSALECLGELAFYARGPIPDTDRPTYGRQQPAATVEMGRMLTTGWKFYGKLVQEQGTVLDWTTTNVVLDFNTASAQTVLLLFSGASGTNRVYATNVNMLLGTTNFEPRTFRLIAGDVDRPLRWPTAWSVVSESGTATLPTLLPAGKILLLHLTAWGSGETNIVAQFGMGPDKSYAIDPDAQSFFSRAGIADATQTNAVQFLAHALKVAGLWPKIDILYPFVGGTATAHAQNLKSGSYTITWSATMPTHNSDGVTGDASSMYGDTGYVPDYAGAATNAHLLFYCRTQTPAATTGFGGSYTGGGVSTQPPFMTLYNYPPNLSSYGVMAGNQPVPVIDCSSDYRGVLGVSRMNSGSFFGVNRSATATVAQDSTGAPDLSYYVLAVHKNAGAGDYSDANLALASAGVGLTEEELVAYRDIINQFETILGRQVP